MKVLRRSIPTLSVDRQSDSKSSRMLFQNLI